MENNNKNYIPQKSDFEQVQMGQKIYDKKFETKPLGYFKDAMLRFSKNKTNVVATIILFTIIFLAIAVPILSNKMSEGLEEQVAYLPPRVPILENLGILDGTVFLEDQLVDPNTIDPETGLGIPYGFRWEVVEDGSLSNYTKTCTYRRESCIGGENQFLLDAESTHVSILSSTAVYDEDDERLVYTPLFFDFEVANNPVLNLEVVSFGNVKTEDYESYFNIYVVTYDDLDDLTEFTQTLVARIDQIGDNEIVLFDEIDQVDLTDARIKIEFVSDDDYSDGVIQSFSITEGEEIIHEVSGYELASYKIDANDDGAGSWVRNNGTVLYASFRYLKYEDKFYYKEETIGQNEYLRILEENANVCVDVSDLIEGNEYLAVYSDFCPIRKVVSRDSGVPLPDGTFAYTYDVLLNYQVYKGYDSLPYYIFGTDASGRDLFKLIWIGTRTSLLIGFIVAAINISVGIIYGAISGYYGGATDIIMQRFAEIMGRIPWLVTLSIFVTLIGPGIKTLILILIINGWIGVAGVTRTQFYRYKGREYVLASRTLGAKDGRLIFRHILPNGIGTIITSSILSIPGVIFAEATISYLGFGIGHGQYFEFFGLKFSGVSIGVLLSDGRTQLLERPYLTIFPSIIISILMITFNMFGNALRDAFNPALRGSE